MQDNVHLKKESELLVSTTLETEWNSWTVFPVISIWVTLASDLSWSLHVTNCCNRTCRLVGLLYRQFYKHTSPPCPLRLYKSFIRPHLEYVSVVWNPYYRGEIVYSSGKCTKVCSSSLPEVMGHQLWWSSKFLLLTFLLFNRDASNKAFAIFSMDW